LDKVFSKYLNCSALSEELLSITYQTSYEILHKALNLGGSLQWQMDTRTGTRNVTNVCNDDVK